MTDRLLQRNAVNVPLQHGKSYLNGHGDVVGPMVLHDTHFWDQYGRVYHHDGRQWDHVPDSAGNIVSVLVEGNAGS
jgi:hypothetical protein